MKVDSWATAPGNGIVKVPSPLEGVLKIGKVPPSKLSPSYSLASVYRCKEADACALAVMPRR